MRLDCIGEYDNSFCLQLQLQRLLFLCAQLKKCLNTLRKTNERNLRAEELANRRIILEEWSDHLVKMKSRLEPVRSVRQKELKFDNVEQLCQAVSKLGFIPLDPSKCEVFFPPLILKKMAGTITITLKDRIENVMTDGCNELNVVLSRMSEVIKLYKCSQLKKWAVEYMKHHSWLADVDTT